MTTEQRPPIRPRDDDWPEPRDFHRELADKNARLREALLEAREALKYALRFLNRVDHDVDFVDDALAAIDTALKGDGK